MEPVADAGRLSHGVLAGLHQEPDLTSSWRVAIASRATSASVSSVPWVAVPQGTTTIVPRMPAS